MADAFARLDSAVSAYLESLSPAERRRTARKIGMALRKANAKRIADNVQPDGSPMQPRKPRRLKAGKGQLKRDRMFRKLRLARSFKVRASADGVSIGFEGSVGQTARAHQYGLIDFVGRTEGGKVVRAKYPKRILLGFGPDDLDAVNDIVLDMLPRL
ncbi:phage virion morphogenesis protein [Novosphingobium pentaromativorans]|uniref:Phage virion morphogenesis protein n=1 Tax=Novosphingobium pentaromativorans US6-1 TaxID=1088721 RepID=G6EFJ0_9SPHN|nr:phage virion morphogenesis protein [Novosphingobium pentaromativorans]AIT79098.1 hypothetical protein JI59_04390 [Novosphingobium pentaromativorans US6-1]EHJ59938.1 hypothetical protein NSU_3111 [Novosphingobium pentaromativorans US6-1]